MSKLIYKKLQHVNQNSTQTQDLKLPSFEEIKKRQNEQLVELAKARLGFNDDKFDQSFTPLKININQSEQQILRLIMKVPPLERCEQILYAIASENINLQVANNLIRAIGILERLSYIQSLEIESEIFSLPKSKTQI